MITIIPAERRHFNDMDWLKTYWLFSFNTYYDPENLRHGTLRVFNDDVVAGQTGFGTHPHEEMEIISLVLEGEMEHRDTMGNTSLIRKNDVQRMTAGAGLQHSERNLSDTPVHFFQIWIEPDAAGLAPSYDQKTFSPEHWHNTFALLASSRPGEDWVTLNTDGSLYRASIQAGRSLSYESGTTRNLFVYVIKGNGRLNNNSIDSGDQARIAETRQITVTAEQDIDLILIDIPGAG